MTSAVIVIGGVLLASSPEAATRWVVGHDARLEGDALVWRTTVIVQGGPAPQIVDLVGSAGELAWSLPTGLVLRAGTSGAPDALAIQPDAWVGDPAQVSFETRHAGALQAGALRPPLLAGAGVQRVTLTGVPGLRFVPIASTGLEHHLTSVRQRDIGRRERLAVDRALGAFAPFALYVRASPAFAAGIPGELSSAPARRPQVLGVFGALTALFIVMGGILYRRLQRPASVERAWAALQSVDLDENDDVDGAHDAASRNGSAR